MNEENNPQASIDPRQRMPDQGNLDMPSAQPQPPALIAEQPVAMTMPAKSRKRTMIIIVALLLLIGGSVAVYLLLVKKGAEPARTAQPTTVTQQKGEQAVDRIIYQAGDALVSYDPVTKKSDTLIPSLPKSSRVLDAYVHTDGWRAYYQTSDDAGASEFWFATNKTQPTKVAASREFAIPVANAEKQLLAYTAAFSVEQNAAADDKTTRTYLVHDGQLKLVWQSGTDSMVEGPKSPGNTLSDITGDGKRMLFRSIRFYSDGGSPVNAFELDLATNQTKQVYNGKRPGSITYDDKDTGYIVTESDDFGGLGDPNPPGDVTVYHIASLGATPQTTVKLFNTIWSSVNLSHDFSLAYAGKDTQVNGSYTSSLVGLFRVTGATDNAIQQVALTGAPTGYNLNRIGKAHSGCYGTTFSSYNNASNVTKQDVGVLCVTNDTTATYTSLNNLEAAATTSPQTVDIIQ